MRPVRVLAADRQPLFREALARAVRRSSALQLVAEAADGRAALAAIDRHRPDVAIVDLRLPLLDGARVLNAVIRDELPTRVVLVAGEFDGRTAYNSLAAGAAGVLPRTIGEEEVRAAVAAVASGSIVIGAREQTAVATEIRAAAGREDAAPDRARADVPAAHRRRAQRCRYRLRARSRGGGRQVGPARPLPPLRRVRSGGAGRGGAAAWPDRLRVRRARSDRLTAYLPAKSKDCPGDAADVPGPAPKGSSFGTPLTIRPARDGTRLLSPSLRRRERKDRP